MQDATAADLFLVAFRTGTNNDDLGMAIISRQDKGVSVTETEGWDRTKRTGVLQLDAVQVSADAVLGEKLLGGKAIETLIDRGALAVSAEAIGVCEGILSLTSQYALDRNSLVHPLVAIRGLNIRWQKSTSISNA